MAHRCVCIALVRFHAEVAVDDFIDILPLHVGVLENLLDGLQCLTENIYLDLLRFCPGKSLREIITLFKALHLNPNAPIPYGQGVRGGNPFQMPCIRKWPIGNFSKLLFMQKLLY